MTLLWIPINPAPPALSGGEVALGMFALICLFFAVLDLIRFYRALPRPGKDGHE